MSHPPFQAPHPEHLAELMPQYDIESFIAQGGMGAVYKGRQRSLERDVAIKILPKELGESEFREAFATEAKAMARLNHPNLIGVFDFGEVDEMPYITMEYVHGQSLFEASHNQAIDPLQAIDIVKGICEGLAHAHENGIVHRDIKPANILLTVNAKPKIGDFGLAHAADSIQPGLVMGTPGYTAPEVFHNPDLAGPLADLYSVGVILHQLLTGVDPSGCLEPPTQLTGNIRLDAIWRKAVNVDPNQRYQSAASMADDMEKWVTTKTTGSLITGRASFSPSVRPTPVTASRLTASRYQSLSSPVRPTPVTASRLSASRYQTFSSSVQPIPVTSSGSGGMIIKWFIIAILGAVAVFTYQLLQENKEDIKQRIAIANGTDPDVSTTVAPVPAPPPATLFKPKLQAQERSATEW